MNLGTPFAVTVKNKITARIYVLKDVRSSNNFRKLFDTPFFDLVYYLNYSSLKTRLLCSKQPYVKVQVALVHPNTLFNNAQGILRLHLTSTFSACSEVCGNESAGNGFTNEYFIVVLYSPYESTRIQIDECTQRGN